MFSYRTLTPLAALAAWLLVTAPAPAALTAEVRDDGGFFKPETVKEADQAIRAIKHDHGQDLVIETYAGIPADKKAEYEKVKDDKEKRKHFFAEWGRERFKQAEVNGVYVLISKDPGYLQIEVGNRTAERAFTMKNRDHLEEMMLKEMHAKEYDKALIDGVEYVRKMMDDNLGKTRAERPAPQSAPPTDIPGTTTGLPSLFSHGGWLGLICVGLAVVAGILVLFAIIRGFGTRRPSGPDGSGGPAYGGGYGYGGGGGGGFLSGMLGGLFGGAAGGWLYDRFFRGGGASSGGYGGTTPAAPEAPPQPQQDTDASGIGGDFGDDNGGSPDTGGGDFGGDTGGGDIGGDTGGGDFAGGGDTAGGDAGGGDF